MAGFAFSSESPELHKSFGFEEGLGMGVLWVMCFVFQTELMEDVREYLGTVVVQSVSRVQLFATP